MISRKVKPWAILFAAIAGAAVIQYAGVPTALAAAPPQLERKEGNSGTDSVSPKEAIAVCPAGKRVVGGGGSVFTTPSTRAGQIVLTRLQPVRGLSQGEYRVTANEVGSTVTGSWAVRAYAMCAPEPPGYQILSHLTDPASTGFQSVSLRCPVDKEPLGTGSEIIGAPSGQVTLQSSFQLLRRTTDSVAQENVGGYDGLWRLRGWAICADEDDPEPTPDVVSRFLPSGTDTLKFVAVTCPDGEFAHGTGADIALLPPGVAITSIAPLSNLRTVQVVAVETAPTIERWGLVVQAICRA